jgi:hypothetical protein
MVASGCTRRQQASHFKNAQEEIMRKLRSYRRSARRIGVSSILVASALTAPAAAQMPKVGDAPEAKNMRLVGYNDLQARSAYQPTIHKHGERYIAYIGHHGGTDAVPKPVNPVNSQPEFNGTSIVDVTDPKNPKYLKHLPGLEGNYEAGGAQMVRVCDGASLPKGDRNAVYMLRVFGGQAHEIWNVAEPANPMVVTRIVAGKDTHKNWWECDTGIAYLVSGEPAWRGKRMMQVYDLSDPKNPVKIRDFGLPGQVPGAPGAVPTDMHGAISTGRQGNRVYVGYGTNKGGVVQIIDREKLINGPKEATPENLSYPVISQIDMIPYNGAHTTFPMMQMPISEFAKDKDGKLRDFVMIVDEQILNECQEARQLVFFAEVTIESRPMIVSNFQVPEKSGSFCDRGGRFGAHASNESMGPPYYKKVAFISYFNAGVRAVDLRDPYSPKEIGYFIPPITEATDKRCIKVNGEDRCKVAIQTNNVETDDRGLIYIVDRANTGMHILELTPEGKAAAGLN